MIIIDSVWMSETMRSFVMHRPLKKPIAVATATPTSMAMNQGRPRSE